VVYKGVTDVLLADLPPGSGGPFLVGMIASAASGFVAIDVLLGYVRRHDYTLFVIYRLALAAFVVGLILTGARDATF
jgi:undecaprenyl-diphosphatase